MYQDGNQIMKVAHDTIIVQNSTHLIILQMVIQWLKVKMTYKENDMKKQGKEMRNIGPAM